jgi:8-oxo-dGTP diphosphatase
LIIPRVGWVVGSDRAGNETGGKDLAGPETPKLVVDVVIPAEEGVVLIRRGSDPFEGQWTLPGGFVEVGETVEEAARREAAEETGLAVELAHLVGVYSEPDRDPRGHNVSVAFLARVLGGDLSAASDAAEVSVLDPESVNLAFDHRKIVEDALRLS